MSSNTVSVTLAHSGMLMLNKYTNILSFPQKQVIFEIKTMWIVIIKRYLICLFGCVDNRLIVFK